MVRAEREKQTKHVWYEVQYVSDLQVLYREVLFSYQLEYGWIVYCYLSQVWITVCCDVLNQILDLWSQEEKQLNWNRETPEKNKNIYF